MVLVAFCLLELLCLFGNTSFLYYQLLYIKCLYLPASAISLYVLLGHKYLIFDLCIVHYSHTSPQNFRSFFLQVFHPASICRVVGSSFLSALFFLPSFLIPYKFHILYPPLLEPYIPNVAFLFGFPPTFHSITVSISLLCLNECSISSVVHFF